MYQIWKFKKRLFVKQKLSPLTFFLKIIKYEVKDRSSLYVPKKTIKILVGMKSFALPWVTSMIRYIALGYFEDTITPL